jgi:hypothetical protein
VISIKAARANLEMGFPHGSSATPGFYWRDAWPGIGEYVAGVSATGGLILW